MCFSNLNCLQAHHPGISFGTVEHCSESVEGVETRSLFYTKVFKQYIQGAMNMCMILENYVQNIQQINWAEGRMDTELPLQKVCALYKHTSTVEPLLSDLLLYKFSII